MTKRDYISINRSSLSIKLILYLHNLPQKDSNKQKLQKVKTPHSFHFMSTHSDKNQQMAQYIVAMTQKLSKAFKQINEMSVQFLKAISGNQRSQRLRNRCLKEKQREKTKLKDKNDDLNSNLIDEDEDQQEINGLIPKKKIKIKNRIEEAQQEDIQQLLPQQKPSLIKTVKKRQQPSKPDQQEKIEEKKKVLKPISHKPKAPTSSFLLFFKQQQQSIAKSYPNYGVVELTRVAAKCWNDLSVEDKEPYQKLFEVERKKYQQEMEKYRRNFPEEVKQKELEKKEKKKKKAKQRREKENAVAKNPQTKQKVSKAPVVNENYFPKKITPSDVKLQEQKNVNQENQQIQAKQNKQPRQIKNQPSRDFEKQMEEFNEEVNSLGEDV